jgi:polyhydroxyalkanoate synthesis regulator phasin
MLDTIRTLLLAGVGAIDLTEDKVRSIAAELVRRGEIAADEARDWVALWQENATADRRVIDQRLDAALDEALGLRNLASQDSVAALGARLDRLEEVIERLVPVARES